MTFTDMLTQRLWMHGTCTKQAQSTRITHCRRQAPATAPNHTTLDYWISNPEKGSYSVHSLLHLGIIKEETRKKGERFGGKGDMS